MPLTWGWPQTPNIYLEGEGAALFSKTWLGAVPAITETHVTICQGICNSIRAQGKNQATIDKSTCCLRDRLNPFPCVHVHLNLIALELVM